MSTPKQQGERLVVDVVVASASKVKKDGPNGPVIEWAIKAYIPELNIRDFTTPFWIRGAVAADIFENDRVRCLMRRGNLKTDKDKQPHTGQYDSHYYWECDEWNTQQALTPRGPSAAAPNGASSQGGPGSQDEYRRSKEEMRYLECLKVAAISFGPERDAWHDVLPIIENRANDLYDAVTAWEAQRKAGVNDGAPDEDLPFDDPGDEPEAPAVPAPTRPVAQPAPAPLRQAQGRPAAPAARPPAQPAPVREFNPVAVVVASLNRWNKDVKAGARVGQQPYTLPFVEKWARVKYDVALTDLTPEQATEVATRVGKGDYQ